MRIISKQVDKDYYDSLLALGQDPGVTYKREPEEIDIQGAHYMLTYRRQPLPKGFPKEVHDLALELGVFQSKQLGITINGAYTHWNQEQVLIGFCGRLYLASRIFCTSDCGPQGERYKRWHYEADKLAQAFPELKRPTNKQLNEYGVLDRPGRHYGLDGNLVPDVEYRRLDQLNQRDHSALFRDVVQAPAFSVCYRLYTTNPVLNGFEFFRAVDAPSAFQSVESYLSNQFLGQYPLPVPLTEKEQVNRYGFDPKYGFRTRPGGGSKSKNK